MELRHIQEMQELRSSLEKQEYFTFSQAARLMGVSRQYIYKLVMAVYKPSFADADSFRRTYTFSLYPISRRSGKKRKRKRTEPPRVKIPSI